MDLDSAINHGGLLKNRRTAISLIRHSCSNIINNDIYLITNS